MWPVRTEFSVQNKLIFKQNGLNKLIYKQDRLNKLFLKQSTNL